MKLLIVFAVLALLGWYAALGRDWLQAKPWTAPFYSHPWVEWIEIKFWKKSQTILWARTKMFGGVVLTTLTQLGTLDLSPLLPFIPDEYEPLAKLAINLIPMVITVMGMIDEKNRNNTTKPLEMVALPEVLPPHVAEAIAVAEEAKAEAVATVAASSLSDPPDLAKPKQGD